MSQKKDYYTILNIPHDAGTDQIKRSYRKLAQQYHPDMNKAADAEERMKEINEAYDVLGNPEKRAHYDRFGHQQNTAYSQAQQGSYTQQGNPYASFEQVFQEFYRQQYQRQQYQQSSGTHGRGRSISLFQMIYTFWIIQFVLRFFLSFFI